MSLRVNRDWLATWIAMRDESYREGRDDEPGADVPVACDGID
ncbi:hypothetical protein [Burkholderia latens]|nr:hypothetical protein [Burkholderia latens]